MGFNDFDGYDAAYDAHADRLAREPRCEECDFTSPEALAKCGRCKAVLCVECFESLLCGEAEHVHGQVVS